jgi:hypothetical protein
VLIHARTFRKRPGGHERAAAVGIMVDSSEATLPLSGSLVAGGEVRGGRGEDLYRLVLAALMVAGCRTGVDATHRRRGSVAYSRATRQGEGGVGAGVVAAATGLRMSSWFGFDFGQEFAEGGFKAGGFFDLL